MQVKSESMSKTMSKDSLSFTIIFVLCFAICFVVSLFMLILPNQWRLWLPGAERGKSLLESVKAGVYSFMSFLT